MSASGLNVRLSKQQIDKASKKHTERFSGNFMVSMVVSRIEGGGCRSGMSLLDHPSAGTNGRGSML